MIYITYFLVPTALLQRSVNFYLDYFWSEKEFLKVECHMKRVWMVFLLTTDDAFSYVCIIMIADHDAPTHDEFDDFNKPMDTF